MTVYVDILEPPLGKAARCHVMADSTAELTAALTAAEVAPIELARPGTAWEHMLVPFATGEAMVEDELAEAVTVYDLDALARGRS